MKHQIFRLVMALFALFVLVACQPAQLTEEQAQDIADQVAYQIQQEIAEAQKGTAPTETPEPTATPTTMVLIPATPVKIESEATTEPSAVIMTAKTLEKSFVLSLPEFFSEDIVLAGWAPIDLSPNGDWYKVHTANDTWQMVQETWKREAPGCEMPGACNVFAPNGVLGADKYEDAVANKSAVWTGSMWHDSPDNTDNSFSMLCPEGAYCDAYAQKFGLVTIGDHNSPYIVLQIPSCGPSCGQALRIRNWLARPGVDLNTNVEVYGYGANSAASWTEYVVPPEWAEWFSQSYATAQAVNGHNHNVNGSGGGDNFLHIEHIIDLNDMSYTILGHTADRGWFLIWTNVLSYGTH